MTYRAYQSLVLLGLLGCALGNTIGAQSPDRPQEDATSFENTVQPFLAKNCVTCHNAKMKTSDLDLEAYRDDGSALQAASVWEKVLEKLQTGQMPPPGRPRPAPEEIRAVSRWIESILRAPARNNLPDPGRVTARRLNRVEYNNTIRDLLAVDLRPANDFPTDDEGYGFDNIGDVLSLSPVLMEKYLSAAEKIAGAAIVVSPVLKPTVERYKAETLKQSGFVRLKHAFPADAEYDLRTGLGGLRPDGSEPLKLAIRVDDRQVKLFDVEPARDRPRTFDVRVPIKEGERQLRVSFVDDTFKPEDHPINGRDRYLTIDYLEVRGPFNAQPPSMPEGHKKVFTCGHPNGTHHAGCARKILTDLARRAYRRPVTAKEVDDLLRFVNLAEKEGDSFEQGIRLALQAVLVSPHFLFRIERDPQPMNPGAVHKINEHELATRLSYFLWSSMPDEELIRCADEQSLRRPGVLEAQVRRMLLNPKARALVENFAGQWLQLRNLDNARPDRDRFPGFDDELRADMRRETELFFEALVREDRSILDFIDGKFTYLNERLARHYGIEGVQGDEFRRFRVNGDQRSGVLTQASILTVSSYSTRTSPVLRGKWVLENFLNAPPPPPPPDVPNLKEEAVGTTGSLRQQLEAHRSNPTCASCHARMDVLGFGLENYDAIGAWRARDGKFLIDPSGTLPGGRSFRGPGELKTILKKDRDAFAWCLTEKMLTYALGRGLENYDKSAVELVTRRLASNGYRFSRLVIEIVNSMPFQMRRGERGKR